MKYYEIIQKAAFWGLWRFISQHSKDLKGDVQNSTEKRDLQRLALWKNPWNRRCLDSVIWDLRWSMVKPMERCVAPWFQLRGNRAASGCQNTMGLWRGPLSGCCPRSRHQTIPPVRAPWSARSRYHCYRWCSGQPVHYPLVNIQKTMENHQILWVNQL